MTIQGIVTLAEKAHANGLPPLLIEDISRPRGGPMPGGHAAHQVGLDVDVALDMRTRGYLTERAARVDPDREPRASGLSRYRAVDVERVGGAAVVAGGDVAGVDRVLVNAAIKQQLCRTVTGDRSWLRYIRPWYGHAAHMHIHFKCPPDQTDCVAQAPPPPGDGCDATLQWWFDQLGAPTAPPGPPKPKPRLPEACYAMFGWEQ